MALTIEQAARKYIRHYENWQHAKKAHADFLHKNDCVHQAQLSKGWEDEETEPPRCYERYYDDCPVPESEWCDTCKRSILLYQHRVDMARRKGSAHRVLRATVARAQGDQDQRDGRAG